MTETNEATILNTAQLKTILVKILQEAGYHLSDKGGWPATEHQFGLLASMLTDQGVTLVSSAPELDVEWQALARDGRKINAIKVYRDVYDVGLFDGKVAVENYIAKIKADNTPKVRKVIQLVSHKECLIGLYDNGEIDEIGWNTYTT